MMKDELTIGALAKAGNVNVETIRYYQRIGLLPVPERSYRTIRRYSNDSLKRVHFIKRAQRLGFSLDEIRLLLGLADDKHCTETRELAEKKLAIVAGKMADLAVIQQMLQKLVASCTTTAGGRGCPIIDSLEEDEPPQTGY